MLFFCSFIIVSCIWFVITVYFLMSVRILSGFVCWHFSVPWRTLCFLQEVFFVLFCFLFSLPCLPLSFSAASFMLKVKSESEVTLSCLTHSDPMDCSLPGPSIHGIFQARVLEWGAIAFSLRVARSSKWKYKTPFTKNKCMYSIHGETKQTKTSEFGAKKSLLQGQERTSSLCSKNPQLLNGFQGVFIGKIWGGVT